MSSSSESESWQNHRLSEPGSSPTCFGGIYIFTFLIIPYNNTNDQDAIKLESALSNRRIIYIMLRFNQIGFRAVFLAGQSQPGFATLGYKYC